MAVKDKAKVHPRVSLAAAMPATPFEEAENATVRARLKHERAYLVTKRRQTVASFDAALRAMRREKAELEYELKLAEMKQLTLNRELVMLKKFEQKENELDGRLEESIQAHVNLCNDIERREEDYARRICSVREMLERSIVSCRLVGAMDSCTYTSTSFSPPVIEHFE